MLSRAVRYVASVAPMPGKWRAQLYRLAGVNIGPDVWIDRNVHITRPDLVALGARVVLANGVSLLAEVDTGPSRLGVLRPSLVRSAPIGVGADAMLTTRCVVLPGVTIGACAVVAAHAVVRADVPAQAIVAGLPARIVGKINDPAVPGISGTCPVI